MSKPSLTNELTRLYELLEKGAITKEEYEEHKALLLSQAHGTPFPDDEYSNPAQTKSAEEKSQININQSTSAAASSSAAAIAKNGDCMKTTLAAIGFLAVVAILLQTCSGNEKTTPNTPASEPAPQNIADTDNQKTTQENIQALLQSALQENVAANNEINTVWTDMDTDVRNYLKPQQLTWSHEKKKQCQTNEYTTPEQNQIAYLNCETNITRTRILELQAQKNQIYTEIKEAQLQKVKQEAKKSLETLHTTWDTIPEPIKDQLNSNFKNWTDSANNECDTAKPADTQVQTDINRHICITKLAKAKIKELQGYKI
jgi:hypothetical protein